MADDWADDLATRLRHPPLYHDPAARPWIKWIGPPPPGDLSVRFADVLARTSSTACPIVWAGARCMPDGTHEFHLNIFGGGDIRHLFFVDVTAEEAKWMERVASRPAVVIARDDHDLLRVLEEWYAPVRLLRIGPTDPHH